MPSFRGLKPASWTASEALAGNKRADTSCEIELRRALWRRGLRFLKNVATLPGNPDIVFPRQRVVVFCDGDFWHGKDWGTRKRKLKRGHNAAYWVAKIQNNIRRDRRNERLLRTQGWRVVRLWESDVLAGPKKAAAAVGGILRHVALQTQRARRAAQRVPGKPGRASGAARATRCNGKKEVSRRGAKSQG